MKKKYNEDEEYRQRKLQKMKEYRDKKRAEKMNGKNEAEPSAN